MSQNYMKCVIPMYVVRARNAWGKLKGFGQKGNKAFLVYLEKTTIEHYTDSISNKYL